MKVITTSIFDRHSKSLANSREAKSFIYAPVSKMYKVQLRTPD
jgi:hypothetical protein